MNTKLSNSVHPYHCADENFYSRKAKLRFESFDDFLDEFDGESIEMNLIFRWDVLSDEDTGVQYCMVYMMQQV